MDLNLMKEETLQTILAETVTTSEMAERIALAHQDRVDKGYHQQALEVKSTAEMDALFARWWHAQWIEGVTTRNALLERWFSRVLYDDRVHGVRFPLFSVSEATIGELTDDSASLVCETSTGTKAGRDDFAFLPQFWAVEVAAEKDIFGGHTILAVEHIDPIEKIRKTDKLTWVLQKNTWRGEGIADGYYWLKTRCTPAPGFVRWVAGKEKNGTEHAYMAHPKYLAGKYEDGRLGACSGLKPALWISHSSGVAKWREDYGPQYAGASGELLRWQMDMVRLKYAKKGNSSLINGCSSYYMSTPAAVSEVGVERILVAAGKGADYMVGSTINIENKENEHSSGSPVVLRRITKIEPVTVQGQACDAIYFDNLGQTIDTTAGTSHITTMPYGSGYNDGVLGYDGAMVNPAGQKEPGLIQRTEFQNGAY